jgi:Na+/proline symporter
MSPTALAKLTPAVIFAAAVVVSTATIVSTTTIVFTATIAVPGPDAEKNAARKIRGTVITVRRTGIRIIVVVAVYAIRRWANITRPNLKFK